jgi:hypothetical protein
MSLLDSITTKPITVEASDVITVEPTENEGEGDIDG